VPVHAPSLATSYRTHTCGALRADDAGSDAKLAGWVHRRRDYGKLLFIDLRDRHGITQVVVDAGDAPEAHEIANRARSEFVIAVEGEVARRQPGTENAKLATGEVELQVRSVRILNEAQTPPFYINDPDAPIDESLRLKYRYLDIRREQMQQRLLLRSRLVQAIREVHHAAGFVEVETPNLIKSTPEGARDFIVPSRLQPGSVYALPQSPQQLKQLLMVGGIDRYFQIARCFRDEDLRGDRQPEFTQLDLEMSFVDEATVMAFIEHMVIEVTRATVPDRPIRQIPFPVFEYEEAMERFGSDKPELRFGMELIDLAPALRAPNGTPASGFKVFDLEVGRTGLGPADAAALGMDVVTAISRQRSRAHGYPGGNPITTTLVAERGTGRLLGAQMAGVGVVGKRIDVFATALAAGFTIEALEGLDLSYAPPFAPVYDPILIAASVARKRLQAAERRGTAPPGRVER